jgi:hypothetical protein
MLSSVPKPTDDEWVDAEMLAEEMTGKVIAKSPQTGIADMEKRLRVLNQRREMVLQHADSESKSKRLRELERQIADAQARIKEYRTQLEGRN